MATEAVLSLYNELKKSVKAGFNKTENRDLIGSIFLECVRYLSDAGRIDLVSKVENKEYFAFDNGKKFSRAINRNLYDDDLKKWNKLVEAIEKNDIDSVVRDDLTKILYTTAVSFCACIDLMKSGDQKTPGTFFEYFVACFFSWRIGVEPQNSTQILSIDNENTRLQTDFVFNLGPGRQKFHMPIKTSTRERSIMIWAHQRLLDGVYGTGRFLGTPVLLAETKTDKKKKEVVEICLPDQWKLYQLYIAKLKRIYYLDMPSSYTRLANDFPPLAVKPFADFFSEWDRLSPE